MSPLRDGSGIGGLMVLSPGVREPNASDVLSSMTRPPTSGWRSLRRTVVLGGLLIAITMPPLANADSYRPFRNFRQVDPTGRYYIVVKKNGGPEDPGAGTPVTYEIAERKPGSPPVSPGEDSGEDDAIVSNPDVRVRQGDPVLGRGSLVRRPSQIVISSTGLGFVGLGVRGHNDGDLHSL